MKTLAELYFDEKDNIIILLLLVASSVTNFKYSTKMKMAVGVSQILVTRRSAKSVY